MVGPAAYRCATLWFVSRRAMIIGTCLAASGRDHRSPHLTTQPIVAHKVQTGRGCMPPPAPARKAGPHVRGIARRRDLGPSVNATHEGK